MPHLLSPRPLPRRAVLLISLVLATVAALLPARAQAAATWEFTNLSSCSGCTLVGGNTTFTGAYYATAINNRGDVVGNALGAATAPPAGTAGSYQQGFIWRDGKFTLLPFLSPVAATSAPNSSGSYASRTPGSSAADVNEAGVVVGTSSTGLQGRGPSGGTHAVAWRPFTGSGAAPLDLGPYQENDNTGGYHDRCNSNPGGVLACSTTGSAINENSDIAGSGEYHVASSAWPSIPFVIGGGNRPLFKDITDDGFGTTTGTADMVYGIGPSTNTGHSYRVNGINDSGQVVISPDPTLPVNSNSGTSAVFPSHGSMLSATSIPFDAGGSGVFHAINNAGWVIGRANNHGKLWKGGTVVDLPPLPGDIYSSASAINNRGDVVGQSSGKPGDNCLRATLWKADAWNAPIDINTQITAAFHLDEAHAINDKGQIVGGGTAPRDCTSNSGAVFKPYLVTPPALLTIDDVAVDQADSGTATAEFTVKLGRASTDTITVDYATQDGTGNGGAKTGVDYTAKNGTLTFAPGDVEKKIPVTVLASGPAPDKTFTVKLSNPANTSIDDDTGVGTIRNKSPLQVTVKPDQPKVEVEQKRDGPVPVTVKVEVAVKNTGNVPVDHITLPDKLTLGWDGAAPAAGFPITQTEPDELDLGTVAPGQTVTGTYTLVVTADGRFTLDVLALGDGAGQTLRGFGTGKLESDTKLLAFVADMGAQVRSQTRPGMIRSGSPFLVNVTLENRSYFRKIVVDPVYPELTGNAADGHLQQRDVDSTAANPEGSMAEVRPSSYVVLAPGEKKEYVAVIRTSASDAFENEGGGGGTRATVGFGAPRIRQVDDVTRELTDLPADRVALTEGSTSFAVSIDDAAPQTSPFNPYEAAFYVSAGSVWGLWKFTWGTFRGVVWDLPSGIVKGVINLSSATLNAIDRTVELWYAIRDDPVARAQYINAVADKVATAFEQAPETIALAPSNLFIAVSDAVGAKMERLSKEWEAGDWRGAAFELSTSGTEGVANIATMVGPGLLARFPLAAAKWNAAKTALYTGITTKLSQTVKKAQAVKGAVTVLTTVIKPGLAFTDQHMSRIFGVGASESTKIALYAKAKKLSITIRSRAQQSIDFVKSGKAVVKPYWIKTKNVNELDVEYLGYFSDDVGKVVCKRPISKKTLEKNLARNNVKPGTPLHEGIVKRYETRVKEWKEEFREMGKWDHEGSVKGKWPWKDNGVNPRLQADETSRYGFQLVFDKKKQQYVPQIKVGKTWKFITGDIDIIAITKANGRALTDAEHIQVLKDLRLLIGAQHPESATWIKDGRFWFKAKRDYLTNDGECCLAQYGADGKARAVEFDEALSDPETWTKSTYRIRWKGAYQQGPGE